MPLLCRALSSSHREPRCSFNCCDCASQLRIAWKCLICISVASKALQYLSRTCIGHIYDELNMPDMGPDAHFPERTMLGGVCVHSTAPLHRVLYAIQWVCICSCLPRVWDGHHPKARDAESIAGNNTKQNRPCHKQFKISSDNEAFWR